MLSLDTMVDSPRGYSKSTPTQQGPPSQTFEKGLNRQPKQESDSIVSSLDAQTLRWIKSRRKINSKMKVAMTNHSEKQLREIFNCLDYNREGEIDLQMLKDAAKFVDNSFRDEGDKLKNLPQMFAAMDEDGNGVVDFQEFCAGFSGSSSSTLDRATESQINFVLLRFAEFANSHRRQCTIDSFDRRGNQKDEDDWKSYRNFNTLFKGLPKSDEASSLSPRPRKDAAPVALPPIAGNSSLFSPLKTTTPLAFLDVNYKTLYLDGGNTVYKNRYAPKVVDPNEEKIDDLMSHPISNDPSQRISRANSTATVVEEVTGFLGQELLSQSELDSRLSHHRAVGLKALVTNPDALRRIGHVFEEKRFRNSCNSKSNMMLSPMQSPSPGKQSGSPNQSPPSAFLKGSKSFKISSKKERDVQLEVLLKKKMKIEYLNKIRNSASQEPSPRLPLTPQLMPITPIKRKNVKQLHSVTNSSNTATLSSLVVAKPQHSKVSKGLRPTFSSPNRTVFVRASSKLVSQSGSPVSKSKTLKFE